MAGSLLLGTTDDVLILAGIPDIFVAARWRCPDLEKMSSLATTSVSLFSSPGAMEGGGAAGGGGGGLAAGGSGSEMEERVKVKNYLLCTKIKYVSNIMYCKDKIGKHRAGSCV